MTEFEIATIAYRNATLAHRNASLALQDTATVAAVAQVAATLIVGIAQCALIWAGIRMMRRAADTRGRALENQRATDDKRHAEAMAAFAEQRRADDERHAEAIAAQADTRPRSPDRRPGDRDRAHGAEGGLPVAPVPRRQRLRVSRGSLSRAAPKPSSEPFGRNASPPAASAHRPVAVGLREGARCLGPAPGGAGSLRSPGSAVAHGGGAGARRRDPGRNRCRSRSRTPAGSNDTPSLSSRSR